MQECVVDDGLVVRRDTGEVVNDSVTTLGTLPPAALLLLGAVVLVLGWILLKKLI